MLEFIQTLLQSYQRVLKKNPNDLSINKQYPTRIEQLILAEALLRKNDLVAQNPLLPLQIAIIGPTQAGKSTLVNVLLNNESANVSPLAGYTVHPQGFYHATNLESCNGLQHYFGRFQQLSQTQLSKDRYDCYSLSTVNADSESIPPCVIWDTPDFDSIGSADYKEGVIRTIALADILVLTVSKEKYADQSVWDMMAAIAPLKQPTLICVNKLSEGTESIILNSLQTKWQQARPDAFPLAVSLFYQKQGSVLSWPIAYQPVLHKLSDGVKNRSSSRLHLQFCQYHWQNWMAPIVAEHVASQAWQTIIDEQVNLALTQYLRDYLNHPHHYETFQSAMAELLNLLEIPGVARLLSNTRKVITWPVKQLLKLGRKAHVIADSSQEIHILNQLAEHVLIQLADRLLEKSTETELPSWWKDIALVLRQQRPVLLGEFELHTQHYHEQFKTEIAGAAQRLYLKLQEQPVVLNSLRTTRATADAAVIAMTFYAGGIGLHDLVIAPAMLAVTSLLTESAIGSYVRREEIALKQQQYAQVKQLFAAFLQQKLNTLPTQLPTHNHFNITLQQLQCAEQELSEKRHGLRSF
ncbi:MAG: 50S ribosome-binding GTPase [Methylococcales bacterium]|nr:50S ribosome-binding GTPase [Methylococcales bacterium]